MRLLVVCPLLKGYPLNSRAGGRSRFAFRLLKRMGLSHSVEVCIVPWGESIGGSYTLALDKNKTALIEGVWDHKWYRGFKYIPRLGLGIMLASQTERLANVINRFRPQLIHLHFTGSTFAQGYNCLSLDIPLLLTPNTPLPYDDPGRRRTSFESAHKVAFVSKHNQSFVCQHYFDVMNKSCVIHNCVSEEFTNSKQIPRERRGIVYVGGLTKRKNLGVLIKALSTLKYGPLIVCGDGPLRGEYEHLAAQLKVETRFLGWAEEKIVCDALKSAELFVLPSHAEAFSLSYVEALACGTPIIGVQQNVTELEEVMSLPVGEGFDASTSDECALAELINSVLASECVEEKYRQVLADRARDRFSEEAICSEYWELYKALVASR